MDNHATLFDRFRKQSLFLVWGPPSHGPRSQVLARELGIEDLQFLYTTTRRGLWVAPLKYSYQAVKTLDVLFRKRPKIVFVQSPPSFAALFVYFYCALTNSRYVVDAHSDAFQRPRWTRPQWLYNFLARKAVTTIVTNDYFQQMIERRGGSAFVLRDIPTTFPKGNAYALNGKMNVVVVNTFRSDEPIQEVLKAAKSLDDIHFYVTGKKSEARREILASASENVHFTDYLPNETYYGLLNSSHAVMCLTTRNNTMQRGACEALSLGKPIITSHWPLLQNYFCKGTVYTDNTAAGIHQAVSEMRRNHQRYESEIRCLQIEQQQEWQEKQKTLVNVLEVASNE